VSDVVLDRAGRVEDDGGFSGWGGRAVEGAGLENQYHRALTDYWKDTYMKRAVAVVEYIAVSAVECGE
jgi:hypothetical protein